MGGGGKLRSVCGNGRSTQALGANCDMRDIRQVLDQVCDLLDQLPGVVVLHSALDAEAVHIELTAHDALAIEALRRITLGANVHIQSHAHPSKAGISQSVQLNLVARTSARDSIQFGELQLLGIHLAWHLHSTGVLAAPQANLLLQTWHGATVGA